MALYAIGDLHLSLAAEKPMDIFGGRWDHYMEKIEAGFSSVTDADTLVLCGDLSWALDLAGAEADFRYFSALPGKKIVLKGNHDYWWNTAAKLVHTMEAWGLDNISFLHNNCFFYEGTALCGTRGWFYEEESGEAHDKKIMNRELIRLEASLKAAGEAEKLVFMHYPPRYGSYECGEILQLLRDYGVKRCITGHIHGYGLQQIFEGERDGTLFQTVSADYLDFKPIKIL